MKISSTNFFTNFMKICNLISKLDCTNFLQICYIITGVLKIRVYVLNKNNEIKHINRYRYQLNRFIYTYLFISVYFYINFVQNTFIYDKIFHNIIDCVVTNWNN